MKKYFILNSAVFFCISISQLFCEYEVVNTFPNLTFNDPVGIYYAPDDSDRLFVLEQPGKIKVFNNSSDETDAQVFLDIYLVIVNLQVNRNFYQT